MECKIPLRNKFKEIVDYCIVSSEDFDILNKYKWCIGEGYVMGSIDKKMWRIHRYIMIEILNNKEDKIKIDHINSNKLDNRRENLRIVTHSENVRNSSKRKNASSKYFGVSKNNKWSSTIIIADNKLYASYDIEEHAAYQYNLWIDKYKIIHAKKNNIEKPLDFIEYIKPDKIDKLPIGVTKCYNKYRVMFKHKDIGRYNTMEEASNKYQELLKEFNENRLKEILNSPILRNENNECIIELFNKKKEKVGETIVDEEDYYNLKQYSWYKSHNYVCGTVNKKIVNLHRFIMNYTGENIVDHINNNPLDNRKCNLRIVTPTQNNMNRKSTKNSSSQYIGVNFDKTINKWIANIKFEGKHINLGCFDDEIDAAKARDMATKKYFGEFGNLNF
jgi:hypothetical protein